MRITRHFTTATSGAYGGIGIARLSVARKAAAGGRPSSAAESLVIEAPAGWSRRAVAQLSRQVLLWDRVPARLRPVPEADVPESLWRSEPDAEAMATLPEAERHVSETSALQVFDRLSGVWAYWGWKAGCFASPAEAEAYREEIAHMLACQIAAPELPIWVRGGLDWAYGLAETRPGQYHLDAAGTPQPTRAEDGFLPLATPCLQSAGADLLGPDGLAEAALAAGRLQEIGAAAGVNVSALGGAGAAPLPAALRRVERLAETSAGGSGRWRVICDLDHPEAIAFLGWQAGEEHKAAALVAGTQAQAAVVAALSAALAEVPSEKPGRSSHRRPGPHSAQAGDPAASTAQSASVLVALQAAQAAGLPDSYLKRLLDLAGQGAALPPTEALEVDWDSEAQATTAGRGCQTGAVIPTGFLDRLARREKEAEALWAALAAAVWSGGSTALLFADHLKAGNTAPGCGEIRSAGPGLDYLFLEDTACLTAEINLAAFAGPGRFDLPGYVQAVRLWTLTLDIASGHSSYPSPSCARRSQDLRPLGLGIGNLGALLMAMGLAYDSAAGRWLCAGLAALLTGHGYDISAALAARLGAFPGFGANRDAMLGVIAGHRSALGDWLKARTGFAAPDRLAPELGALAQEAEGVWQRAAETGARHGFRNAQISLIAGDGPARPLLDGTGGGVEPVPMLILPGPAGRDVPECVALALAALGHDEAESAAILAHLLGHGSLEGAPGVTPERLAALGFGPRELGLLEATLPTARDLRYACTPWTLGLDFCRSKLGVPQAALFDPGFDLLAHLGFSAEAVAAANAHVCGHGSLAGAPHLAAQDRAIFASAAATGAEALSPRAHLAMAAAAQPFVSGGVAKAVGLPQATSIAEIAALLAAAHGLGLKAVALQRAGAKLSQPLCDPLWPQA